jgi:hypothetical protein
MSERTVIEGLAGATLSICATLPDTYDEAGYQSTDLVFTAVGEVENYGNHGVTANVAEFTPIDTAVVTKVKGSKNYGTMNLTIGCLPSDAGQDIIEAAAESNNHYSAKIVYPDTSIHWLDVLVSKFEWQDGEVNSIRRITVDFAICRKPIITAQV